jgi:hypothetical protein
MDDHTHDFTMHRRMTHQGGNTVLDDAVDGRCFATADELTGRERRATSSTALS